MSHLFVKLYHYFQRKPLLLWGLFLVIVGLCVYSASRIRLVEDISSFLPQNEENRKINYAYQHLGAANKIVVNIKSADSNNIDKELLTEAAACFADYLSENDTVGHLTHILYEIDQQQMLDMSDFLVRNMPYFLSEEDYARMDTLLTKENIEQQLSNNKQLLLSPMGAFVRNVIIADPLHFSSSVLQGLDIFRLNDDYNLEDGYIFNKAGTEAIVTLTSAYPVSETAQNKLLAEQIDKAIKHTQQHFDSKIKITTFGAALISITNAEQIKKDSIWAICVAMLFIVALLIYFFRSAKSLFLIICSILFGGLFALGAIVLFKDTVSVIALGIASIIIGMVSG